MDIQERLAESERKFEQEKAKREEHLRLAEECLTEMTKLQGEWRILIDIRDSEPKKVNKKATVIDAVPETEKV